MYENVIQTPGETKGFFTLPKYKRDVSKGFWANVAGEFNHFNKVVAPTANKLVRSAVS